MKSLILLFLVHQSSAVIYHLNVTEYSKMPDLYQMDEYDLCLSTPGGAYCLVDAELYSKDDSELMHMIQEYSAQKVKHYNHTKIHRALCITTTCKEFVQNRSLNNDADLRSIIEECVEDSIWKEYKLNTRLTDILHCKKHGDRRPFTIGDYLVAGAYLILIILNAVGTSYDIINGDAAGNPYLLAFSLRRNWRKLIAPSGVGPDPRLNRLKVINGLRSLTMVCVYFSHTMLIMSFFYLKNPYKVEQMYDDVQNYILFNGTLVTYTFFVMSGFLLAFNFELHAEKHAIGLWVWPKAVIMRWLRLTPTYALIMFTVMTMRHWGDGPQWELAVTREGDACRQYWWAHLLYINNYIRDDAECFPQSWYLAADTQLFVLGMLICVLCRKPRTQMVAMAAMFVISLVIPGCHIYFQGYGALVHNSPESFRTLFRYDDTFNTMYVSGHTNMSTYALGIAGGLLAYHWLTDEKSVSQRLQKYSWVMWLMPALGVGTLLSGSLFYLDHFEPSILFKVVYGSLHKAVFQFAVVGIIIGCIFQVENVIRGLLEWDGFTWTGRASYAGFLLHSLFQRGLVGMLRQPNFISEYQIFTLLSASTFLSFGVGALLFVAVESPMAVLVKTVFNPPRRNVHVAAENAGDVTTKKHPLQQQTPAHERHSKNLHEHVKGTTATL